MGVGTRTEVKRAISKGRVSVDGACVKKPETKIDTEETTVVFDGQTVGYTKKEYYMLHKPAGVISATEDAREKTVSYTHLDVYKRQVKSHLSGQF